MTIIMILFSTTYSILETLVIIYIEKVVNLDERNV